MGEIKKVSCHTFKYGINFETPYRNTLSFVTLVTSGLDHHKALHVGRPLEMRWELQIVQSMTVRMLRGVSKFDHITPILLPTLKSSSHGSPLYFHNNPVR